MIDKWNYITNRKKKQYPNKNFYHVICSCIIVYYVI